MTQTAASPEWQSKAETKRISEEVKYLCKSGNSCNYDLKAALYGQRRDTLSGVKELAEDKDEV